MAISYSHYVPNFKCKSSNWESPGASQKLADWVNRGPNPRGSSLSGKYSSGWCPCNCAKFALLWPPVASTKKHDPSVSKNPHPLRWGFHSTCLKPLKPNKFFKTQQHPQSSGFPSTTWNLSSQDSRSQQRPLSWSFLLSSVWNLSTQSFKTQQHPLSWGFPLKPIFLSLSANPPMLPRKFCSVANVHQCTQKNQTKN